MARVKIEDVIDHLDYDMKRALEDAVLRVMPNTNVDRNQLCRVVINLVMNAVSSMDRSGRLIFRTYRDVARRKALLEIEDSGCGISEEHLPRIFDPFFTTKMLGEGTGLGLSTVYGLIKENKGLIEVKQTSEKGTTFRVELPLFQSLDSAEQEH